MLHIFFKGIIKMDGRMIMIHILEIIHNVELSVA